MKKNKFNMKKNIINYMIIFCFTGLFSENSFAQSISGKLINENNEPLSGAAIVLLQTPDSVFVNSTLTNNDGTFSFTQNGGVIIISSLGYETLTLRTESNMGTITMQSSLFELSEILVTASRSGLKKKGNHYELSSVYASPFAKGRDLWEFLKYSPMLRVEKNSVSILGRSPATILIDGRRSDMSYEMLKGIPASDIEKIEILPTPGSAYRASEQNGVVNIVLKKRTSESFLGLAKLSLDQSKYNTQRITTSINYNSKKWYLSSGFNVSNSPFFQEIKANGEYLKTGQNTYEEFDEKSRILNLTGYLNFDYIIDKKQTIGFNIKGLVKSNREDATSLLQYYNSKKGIIDSVDFTKMTVRTPSVNYNIGGNFHYDLKIDNKGSNFKIDADYYRSVTSSENENIYSRQNEAGITQVLNQFKQSPSILSNYYSLKADYHYCINNDNTLKTGLEVYGSSNNNNDIYISQNSNDLNRSNQFIYNEVVSSLYLEYIGNFGEYWEAILGLRLENAYSRGDQRTLDEITSRHNTNVFPSLSISFTPSDIHNLTLDINTGIHRPRFSMLNPFIRYISPTRFIQNNPNLKASKSYGTMISYSFIDDYNFIVDYTYNKDNWTSVDLLVGNNIIKTTQANYKNSHSLQFSLDITKKLFSNNLTLNTSIGSELTKDLGAIEDFVINVENWSYFAELKSNLIISKQKKINAQIGYKLHTPQQWATMKIGWSNELTASFSKQFKNQSILNLGINNLYLPNWSKRSVIQEEYKYYKAIRMLPSFWISFTVPFGNLKVKRVKDRGNIKRME